jgi:hypothetical protein
MADERKPPVWGLWNDHLDDWLNPGTRKPFWLTRDEALHAIPKAVRQYPTGHWEVREYPVEELEQAFQVASVVARQPKEVREYPVEELEQGVAMEWLGRHRWLVVMAVVFAGVVPALIGIIAATLIQYDWAIIPVAALVGLWPGIRANVSSAEVGSYIGWGVGLSALGFLAVPIVLSAVVSELLERAERRISVRLETYLKDRDGFIATEVYAEFKEWLKPEVTEAKCRQMAATAIERGARVWRESEDVPVQT